MRNPPPDFEGLRAESERLRGESVRVRILSVNACLAVVEYQIEAGLIFAARASMDKIRGRIGEIDLHLQARGYVASTALDELRAMVRALQARTQKIQKSLAGAR
jgi:hypothetical protein